jgi:pyrimidine operon attenuation protein/uracil phosphoribosyltransferase
MYVLLNSKQMDRIYRRLALQIWEDYEDLENLAIIGIKTRGVFLARRIAKYIKEYAGVDLRMGELDITFYRDDLSLVAEVPQVKGSDIPFSVEGRDILLVDDVLYTGRTVRAAMEHIFEFGRPRSIKLCVLIDRGWRELPIFANFVGKTITTTEKQVVKVRLPETDPVEEEDVVIVEK